MVDARTALFGTMADAEALDEALLPLLESGNVVLDGYPRTQAQLLALPHWFDVVFLRLDPAVALDRAKGRNKDGWDEEARMLEQMVGLEAVSKGVDLTIDVGSKTPGEIVIEILSAPELQP